MIPARQVIGTLDSIDCLLGLIRRVEKWDKIDFWKIGHETLSYIPAIDIISTLHMMHKQVFLDIKLWDTPRTVEATVKAYGKRGINALSIRDSVVTTEVADIANSHAMQLWAIADGTSASAPTTHVKPEVPSSGIITSDPTWYRDAVGYNKKQLIVPGIRLEHQKGNDHKIRWHPYDAIKAGADYIVLGRTLEDEDWWSKHLIGFVELE